MLPTDSVYGQWPRSGEIDIVEVRGNENFACGGAPLGRQLAGQTMHWGPDPNQNRYDLTHWEKFVTTKLEFVKKYSLILDNLYILGSIDSSIFQPTFTFTVSSGSLMVCSSTSTMNSLGRCTHLQVASGSLAAFVANPFGLQGRKWHHLIKEFVHYMRR